MQQSLSITAYLLEHHETEHIPVEKVQLKCRGEMDHALQGKNAHLMCVECLALPFDSRKTFVVGELMPK